MKKEQIDEFKSMLDKEKALVEKELNSVAIPNKNVDGDWIPDVPDDRRNDHIDQEDKFVIEGTNNAIVNALEVRLLNINKALKKIEEGTYGICEVCGEEIPEERLKANPAATTTVEHSS